MGLFRRLTWSEIATGALVVALVAGIFAVARLGPSRKAPVQAEASWAQGYANLSELTRAADLVGVFRVDTVIQVTKDQTGVEYTDFEATPLNHIKGSVAGAIIIHQTGGPDMLVADDPPMKPGDEYVLFLHEYAPGRYYVLGGPQGRFALDGQNRVWSLDRIYKGVGGTVGAGLRVNGKPLAEFAAEIH